MKFEEWWSSYIKPASIYTIEETAEDAWEAGIQEGIDRMHRMKDPCPECYMRDGDHKLDCSQGRSMTERNLRDEIEEGLNALPLIVVNEIKEHEDGSATAIIDTSPEGTRLLVELGLVSLLEKAIDAENTEYTIKDGLHE